MKGARGRRPGPWRVAAWAFAFLILSGGALDAKTRHVPRDHPTIKLAVYAAAAGDTVLVGRGVYLETNIVVDKPVLIKSEDLFGAIIYGSHRTGDAIFVVRAAARIEGFVLKRSAAGIEQRGSPDAEWEAANLAIFGCHIGISINDEDTNIGRALIRDVVVFGAGDGVGLSTNDAGGMDASRCLIVGCRTALQGYNHLSFRVSKSFLIDCDGTREETTAWRPFSPATSRIELGADVVTLALAALSDPEKRREVISFVESGMFGPGAARALSGQQAVLALAGSIEAEILLGLGEYETAERAWRKTDTAARRAGSLEFEWQALRGLARASKGRGALEEAASYYERAIDLVERWLPDIPEGLYRVNFLEDKMIAYEETIGLLLDLHACEPAGRHREEAFFYAEKAKNLPRLRLLGTAGAETDASVGPEGPLAAEKRETERRIATFQIELQDPDLSGERKDILCSLLEQAEEELNGLYIRLAAAAREEAEGKGQGRVVPAQERPLRYREMKARLEDRAVISYFLGEKRSYAFLASSKGLDAIGLPAASDINAKVEPYLRFLKLHEGTREFLGTRAGRLLFDLLLGPFPGERLAGLRKIVLCPDGLLHYLPFAALVGSDSGGTGRARFWGESLEISYAPSASMALAGTQRGEGGKDGRHDARGLKILAVGNSAGLRCDNRSRTMKSFFFPLTHVKAEVKKIAGYFPREAVTTLIDEETAERRIKSLRLSKFRIVHFATHGILDDDQWWRSALLVDRDDECPEDGFLSALEIAEMDLQARLVVLSACRTGLGRLFRGEGIRGLAGAFMRAGAESVLVSLWSVDDESTSVFMGYFYGFLAAGDSPAAALRKTQLKMVHSKYRDPFYWAPFVLIDRAGV